MLASILATEQVITYSRVVTLSVEDRGEADVQPELAPLRRTPNREPRTQTTMGSTPPVTASFGHPSDWLQWLQRMAVSEGTDPRNEERQCADADGDHRFCYDE